MKHSLLPYVCLFITSLLACGCRKNASDVDNMLPSDSISMKYAQLLEMINRGDYIEAIVKNPRQANGYFGRYALVAHDNNVKTIPSYLTLVRVPLKRSVVYSSVHTAALCELNAVDCIVGVADAAFYTPGDTISSMLRHGKITDIGSYTSPSIEKIIDLESDALLLSAYENTNFGGIERTGVPIIFMADYLETTPLGRAEWIKFIGKLYGIQDAADSIFNDVCHRYESLKNMADASQRQRPKILTERPYSGVWYVPGGDSYMAKMLDDAGSAYPWADEHSAGSLPLDEAKVIERAYDADIWLIKDNIDHSTSSLLAAVPHAKAFDAFPKNVYICNTDSTSIFRDIAFHPEKILSDFVTIFHPDILPDNHLNYYKPLAQ